jgi:hypothetical protein
MERVTGIGTAAAVSKLPDGGGPDQPAVAATRDRSER